MHKNKHRIQNVFLLFSTSKYFPLSYFQINGNNTLSENIADIGGVKLSHMVSFKNVQMFSRVCLIALLKATISQGSATIKDCNLLGHQVEKQTNGKLYYYVLYSMSVKPFYAFHIPVP